jgi:hypothetical protein
MDFLTKHGSPNGVVERAGQIFMSHALTGFDESVFRQLTLFLEISLMKQNDPNWKIPKELFDFFYQVRDHGNRIIDSSGIRANGEPRADEIIQLCNDFILTLWHYATNSCRDLVSDEDRVKSN